MDRVVLNDLSLLILTLVMSFVLTWVLGLTPPLLIRYAFVRRPLRRKTASWIAAGLSVLFWIAFSVLRSATGERPRTGFVWIVMFFVARWIMSRESVPVRTTAPIDHERRAQPRTTTAMKAVLKTATFALVVVAVGLIAFVGKSVVEHRDRQERQPQASHDNLEQQIDEVLRLRDGGQARLVAEPSIDAPRNRFQEEKEPQAPTDEPNPFDEVLRLRDGGQARVAPVAKLSIEALLSAYRENEFAAAAKYEGIDRVVETAGVIRSLGRNTKGDAYITLGASDQAIEVEARFGKAEYESLRSLRRGQHVSVRCRVEYVSLPSTDLLSLTRCGVAPVQLGSTEAPSNVGPEGTHPVPVGDSNAAAAQTLVETRAWWENEASHLLSGTVVLSRSDGCTDKNWRSTDGPCVEQVTWKYEDVTLEGCILSWSERATRYVNWLMVKDPEVRGFKVAMKDVDLNRIRIIKASGDEQGNGWQSSVRFEMRNKSISVQGSSGTHADREGVLFSPYADRVAKALRRAAILCGARASTF